jgi:lysophospholipase L1-like esterase
MSPAMQPMQLGGSGGAPPAMQPMQDAGSMLAEDSGMAASDAMAMEPMREDLGEGDGKDVITIGDSWMLLSTTGIQQSLVKVSGQPYRTYGVGGTRLLNGQIPGQYDSAKSADPDIKTVIMTGGGNDILQTGLSNDCASGGDMCRQQLVTIAEALSDLWAQMGADGVQDVVHILYSSDAGSGVADSIKNAGELERRCAEAPLHCHLLATDDLVMGDLRSDGIHPTDVAYDRIATGVYELMKKEGMRR